MSISSNINLAAQHRNAIINAASSLEGAFEAPISITNINVGENIRNTVAVANRSAVEIRGTLETNANNIYQIGETFSIVDLQMVTGMFGP